jgi:large subunit ribosomal protein L3
MTKGILGKKIGMTQIYADDGRAVPVTVIKAGPCKVIQMKTPEKDGYEAIQLGFQEKKEKKVNKPLSGHFKKSNVPAYRYLREIRIPLKDLTVGQDISVEIFEKGERVDVTGISKGKGFAGVMKRHGYRGGPGSHGSMFNRAPGSIGSSSFPSRVWKGKGLPGHLGTERITAKGLEVVDVKKELNILLVKGAVPGAKEGFLIISKP